MRTERLTTQDLFPEGIQGLATIWWWDVDQLLNVVKHAEPFPENSVASSLECFPNPVTDMELTDWMSELEFFCNDLVVEPVVSERCRLDLIGCAGPMAKPRSSISGGNIRDVFVSCLMRIGEHYSSPVIEAGCCP